MMTGTEAETSSEQLLQPLPQTPLQQFKNWLETPEPLEQSDPELAEHLRKIANRQHPVVKTLVVEGDTRLYITHDGRRIVKRSIPPGRNDPCSCGSGKKYKKCCLR